MIAKTMVLGVGSLSSMIILVAMIMVIVLVVICQSRNATEPII